MLGFGALGQFPPGQAWDIKWLAASAGSVHARRPARHVQADGLACRIELHDRGPGGGAHAGGGRGRRQLCAERAGRRVQHHAGAGGRQLCAHRQWRGAHRHPDGAGGRLRVNGIDAYLSSEFLGGGGTDCRPPGGRRARSGTPFTKKRYREIQDAIAAQKRAEQEAREESRQAERAAALAAVRAAKAATEAARNAEDQRNAAAAQARALADALRAMAGAQQTAETMRDSQGVAQIALQAQRITKPKMRKKPLRFLLAASDG